MWKRYIRSKKKSIFLFMVYMGIFCLIAFLYRIPVDAMVYCAALCIFADLVVMVYSYYRFRQKSAMLQDVNSSIEWGAEGLPKAGHSIEEQYQEIIEKLYQKSASAIFAKEQAMSDMMEYYMLWTHQIKTPIAAMRLLLQSQTDCKAKDELQMELFKIEQYVEMVLQYLRLGSDSTDFLIKEQELDKIIREAVRKYSTVFIKKKIALEYTPTEHRVVSDEKWLSFVIEQILSNALKYTYTGRVLIYMDSAEPQTLVIEDTGIGIQAEDLPRVFDKGYTGYNGRQDKKSTGIGLYLCRQIMKKMGHTLAMESEVGKGTKVKIGLTYKSVRYE